jgi:acetyltransferase-like isoleucine patch superfamily enzyme
VTVTSSIGAFSCQNRAVRVWQAFVNRCRWFAFYLRHRKAFVSLPASTIVGRRVSAITAHGFRSITVGQRVTLSDDVSLETSGDGRIVLGSHTWLSRGVVLAARSLIEIGDHTMVGEYSSLRDFDHGLALNGVPMARQPVSSAPVRLGRDVWIGRGAAILKGATVGEGAVIGANAVVTRDIEAYSICAGVPAKLLRRRP